MRDKPDLNRRELTATAHEEVDQSAKSSESQILPLPVVCARTCRTSLEAVEGSSSSRTSPTYFIKVPCEPGAGPIIETTLVANKSVGKNPRRN